MNFRTTSVALLRFALITALTCAATLAGCGDDDPAEEEPTPQEAAAHGEPFEFSIDSEVQPRIEDYERPGGLEPAPVAAVVPPDGVLREFVENEVILMSQDASSADEAASKYGGEVLDQVEIGDEETVVASLLRVDPASADLDAFVEDMHAVTDNADKMGALRFSSKEGAGVMAIAAALAGEHESAGISWIGQPDDISEQESLEAPGGWVVNMSTSWSQDAYDWPHFSWNSTQQTGVTEAWTLLEEAGLLQNRVTIAVLDQGFCPAENDDFPDDFVAMTAMQGVIQDEQSICNELRLDKQIGLADQGYHGTHVFGAVMGTHDDSYGTTGSAAPIGDPIVMRTGYDPWVSGRGMLQAANEGAQIITMSFRANIPYGLNWSAGPYLEEITDNIRNSGRLLFASAGNSRVNVDDEIRIAGNSIGERAFHVPCEMPSVICVGGLGLDNLNRARTNNGNGSNFGPEDVMLSGPYWVPRGPEPGDTANNLDDTILGTSFSTPYVAGVAALIWAADPSQTADDVEDVLLNTTQAANYGNDMQNGYACALCAVQQILDDTPPAVEITAPRDGAIIPEGEEITFTAEASDFEDELVGMTPTLQWTDGGSMLGTGDEVTTYLCPGTHAITASMSDSEGQTTTDAITIDMKPAVLDIGIGGPRHRSVRVTLDQNGDPTIEDIPLAAAAKKATCMDPDSSDIDQSTIAWSDGSGSSLCTGQSCDIEESLFPTDANGMFQAIEVSAEITHDGETDSETVFLEPCSSSAGSGTAVAGYPECPSGAVVGDVMEDLAGTFGSSAWEDPQRAADLVMAELYGDSLVDLGFCDPTMCDPDFPNMDDNFLGDLYQDHGEVAASEVINLDEALQETTLADFDAALADIQNRLGLYGDSMSMEDRVFVAHSLAVALAYVQFFTPIEEGGEGGFEHFENRVGTTNLDQNADVLATARAGFRGYMTAYDITGDPADERNFDAGNYAAGMEAIEQAEDAAQARQ